jgi:hypothetical protein
MMQVAQSTESAGLGQVRRVSRATRHRLEMQGYVGYDDAYLAEIGPWLRLTPGTFAILAGLATLSASPAFMWGLVPFALVGAIWRYSPVDAIYNMAIRRSGGRRPIPRSGPPRRFAFGLAAALFFSAGLAFQTQTWTIGYGLGTFMTVAPLLPAVNDFCVGAFIYRICRVGNLLPSRHG